MIKNNIYYFMIFIIVFANIFFAIKIVSGSNNQNYNIINNTKVIIDDWKINNSLEYQNITIIMNSNLTIENGGSLTLRNVTLKMNCSYDGEYYIQVKNGGAMYIFDNDNNFITAEDASIITDGDYDDDTKVALSRYNYRYYFQIQNGGEFEMKNSELHECGWEDNGMEIFTNNTRIENNIFSNNFYSVYLDSSYNNLIANNTFRPQTKYAVFLNNSYNNTIFNNNIDSTRFDSAYIYRFLIIIQLHSINAM